MRGGRDRSGGRERGAVSQEGWGDEIAGDVGETEVAPLEWERELLVMDAHEVHERGVEIVDGGAAIDDVEAEVVGGADGAWADACSGEPAGEGVAVVFAAEAVEIFGAALGVGRAAEFCEEEDERVVEETAEIEIVEEGGDGLIDFGGGVGEAFFEFAVLIPAWVEELDEADPVFAETACEETIGGEGALVAGVGAVEVEGFGVLGGKVCEGRDGALHAEGELVLFDASGDGGVAAEGEFVELDGAESVERAALEVWGEPVGVTEVEDGFASGAEGDALVVGGEEAAVPET